MRFLRHHLYLKQLKERMTQIRYPNKRRVYTHSASKYFNYEKHSLIHSYTPVCMSGGCGRLAEKGDAFFQEQKS